jgi:hypothetical protein
MRVGTECCTKCHAAQELTSFILKNVGEVTVCCTLAAMLHPSDMERPTQPYGLGSGVKPM